MYGAGVGFNKNWGGKSFLEGGNGGEAIPKAQVFPHGEFGRGGFGGGGAAGLLPGAGGGFSGGGVKGCFLTCNGKEGGSAEGGSSCKEGSGGRVLRLMVAISYGKGVIECHAYDYLDSRSFASFVNGKFDSMFARADKNGSRMFVQLNAPNQNSALVRRVLKIKRAKQLCIPPRSRDIDAIENFFNLV